jgi:aminoglycoside phosphotransferase (APT) family kinase protein
MSAQPTTRWLPTTHWLGSLAHRRRLAQQRGPSRAWIASVAPRLAAATVQDGTAGDWRTEAVTFTRTLVAVAVVTCDLTGRQVVVKMPCTVEAAEALRRQAGVLAVLGADRRLAGLRWMMPSVLGSGALDGRCYWVEEAIRGTPVTAAMLRHPAGGSLLDDAAGFIGVLHDRTSEWTYPDAAAVQAWVERPLRQIEVYAAARPHAGQLLEALGWLRAELVAALAGRLVRTCWIHGDFWPGNLLASGSVVTGIVDWDRAATHQLPLHDLLHAYFFARRLTSGEEVGDLVVRALRGGIAEAAGVPAGRVADWLGGIPQRPAILLYWLRHISLFIDSEGHRDNRRWLAGNIDHVLGQV